MFEKELSSATKAIWANVMRFPLSGCWTVMFSRAYKFEQQPPKISIDISQRDSGMLE
jgi:hypothetical protein